MGRKRWNQAQPNTTTPETKSGNKCAMPDHFVWGVEELTLAEKIHGSLDI
jgi:hypothetical protein